MPSSVAAQVVKANSREPAAHKANPIHKTARAAHQAAKDMDAEFTDDEIALVTLHIATGRPIKAIAASLHVSQSWAHSRLRAPRMQQLIGRTALATLGLEAGRSIVSLAKLRDSTQDERMRFNVATELLDRAGLGNTTQARSAATPHQFVFAEPTEK